MSNVQTSTQQIGQSSSQQIEERSSQHIDQSNESQSGSPRLTYREKRRIQQAELREKYPDRKRRGPTRGLKYGRRNPEEKVDIDFMDELLRVVGDKAGEFICDCSNWGKDICPLNTTTWAKMGEEVHERLYDKIKGKYNLPEHICGAHVDDVFKIQCSTLYKNWRFRLKEKHFRGKTLAQALSSKPISIDLDQWTWLVCDYWNDEKQKHISQVNKTNKLNQIETTANGSRSTARVFHDLLQEAPTQPIQNGEGSLDPIETDQEPLYIKLFEKTKKHKSTGWEPKAERSYEELKKLHAQQIEKNGKDTLSVQAAYLEVFKHKSGYVRGLGAGARPPKKSRAERENNEVRVELSAEIQQLKEDAAQREVSLVSQIDTLKASNDELRTSNQELIASNDELKAAMSRMNIENIKREKKLREDMMSMIMRATQNG